MQQTQFDYFWNKGNGKSFADQANHNPAISADGKYDAYFLEHDE